MRFALALLVAAASGFCALSYEILWYRAFAFLTGSSAATFGVLLGYYLLGLGGGAFASGTFCRDRTATGDPHQLRRLAAFIVLANVASFLVVPCLARLATAPALAILDLLLVVLAAALAGAVLPLVCHFGIAADRSAGAGLSYVYLANIVGSAGGSLLTGFVLLDVWSTRTTSVFLLLLGLALAAAVAAASGLSRARLVGAGAAGTGAIALALAAAPFLFDQLWERLLYKQTFTPAVRFAEVIENRSGVITVCADGAVYGGGAYDGVFNTSLLDNRNRIARAYALGALHPAPTTVLMIGLSSGSWAEVIAHLPGVERLTVIEINPGYVALVGRHPEVAGLLHDARVGIVIDDARRWLLRHPEPRFDAIVMNTTWHWRAHTTGLLSAEFMQLARAHLAPGGIFYFNTTSSPDVQRTAVTLFPHALLVGNFMAVSDAPFTFDRARWRRTLTAVASDGRPALDPARDEERSALDAFLALPDTITTPPSSGGLEGRESIVGRTVTARLVTDDNMVPEWTSPLNLPVPAPAQPHRLMF